MTMSPAGGERSLQADLGLSRRAALLLLAATPLAACQTVAPARRSEPVEALDDRAPIAFNVASLDVEDRTAADAVSPAIASALEHIPAAVMRAWARARLVPVGASGQLRAILTEASFVEEGLQLQSGFASIFTDQQASRFRLRLAVRLEAADPARGLTAFTEAAVERTETLRQRANAVERRNTLIDMVNRAMLDLDTRVEQGVRRDLMAFLRS